MLLHTQAPPAANIPQPTCLACSSSAALTGTQSGRTALSWCGKFEPIGDGPSWGGPGVGAAPLGDFDSIKYSDTNGGDGQEVQRE